MEDDAELSATVKSCTNDIDDEVDGGPAALNSTILNYYKKFGRKRDLEQYFSLSTAQSEIRDPTSLFWRRIKAMSDSSDSGEKRSASPTELCRISIRCTNLESPSPQENVKTKSDSESPPIITEDVQADTSKHSDNESVKSDDNMSQKSMDATLDTSMNKLFSPSSSITSQRKLEWDSLADVGYANETDNKNSASSLSTLERLALKQHCSNNDAQNSNIGIPTAHSTPQDGNDSKSQRKSVSKTAKIVGKDKDFVQFNVPHGSDINKQFINVNLTKHISFNMDRDHKIVKDVIKEVSVTPDTIPGQNEEPNNRIDKEIQTTLPTQKEKYTRSAEMPKSVVPVLINLNTLRRKRRRKIVHHKKSIPRTKRKESNKENTPVQEKTGEQVSEAESFEYMPGHIYNQNQMNKQGSSSKVTADNKSSLESSGNFTTDSSKGSAHSFTKDLQKSLNLLRVTLNKRYDNSTLKQKFIKEVVQRLLKSSYRDDESTTDFLSGLSFGSVKLGMSEATTSTSEGNTTEKQPKKSILRRDKFNSSLITSTSQSAPNLPTVTNSEKPVSSTLRKLSSNTDSDVSSREKISNISCQKTSSEELYEKYLDALKREQAYKKHLKDKEKFLKQKLVCSDTAIKMPVQLDTKVQTKLKDLMKDLTRNNYDDGSGDASKLEGGSNSNYEPKHIGVRKHRSHSVFTLSSGEFPHSNRKDSFEKAADESKPGPCKDDHFSCYPSHIGKVKTYAKESSTQVNLGHESEKCYSDTRKNDFQQTKVTHYVSDSSTGDIKYVCICPENVDPENGSGKILVYKCSRVNDETTPIQAQIEKVCKAARLCDNDIVKPGSSDRSNEKSAVDIANLQLCTDDSNKLTKSSQTKLAKLSNECSLLKDYKTDDKEVYYVHTTTRQLQTEISINPRISDPSLCDIKVIGNTECAKLISEQYTKISKSSLGQTCSEPMVQALNIGSEMSDGTSVPREMKAQYQCSRTFTCNTKTSVEDYQSDFENLGEPRASQEIQDKLTIPIKGTNMTLMVKIGQKPLKPSKAGSTGAKQTPKTSPHEGQIPHHEGLGENSTSYLVSTLFAQKDFNVKSNDTPSDTRNNEDKSCGVQNDLLDDFFATDSQKLVEDKKSSWTLYDELKPVFNTYPKSAPKRLHRSNTDVNNLRTKCDCKQPRCGCDLEYKEHLHPNAVLETAEDWRSFRPIKFMPEMVRSRAPEDTKAERFQIASKSSAKSISRTQEPRAPAQGQSFGKPECPCPEMAVCGKTCDETAGCFQNASKSGAKSISRTQEPLAPAQSVQMQKFRKPEYSELAVSGRTGDETAECFQNATKSEAKPYSPAEVSVAPAKRDILKEPECSSLEKAVSKGTRDETAGFFQNTIRSGSERVSRTQEVEAPAQKKPECPCPENAVCRRTCDKTAECYAQQPLSEIETNTSETDFGYLMKQRSDKYNYMQTQPHRTRSVEARKESATSSTNTNNTHHSDIKNLSDADVQTQSSKEFNDVENLPELETSKNFIIELINDITKRYTKKDIQKNQRKKCFNEIMKILNYLLDTEDPDPDVLKTIHDATSLATDSEQDIKNKIVFKCATGPAKLQQNVASCSKPQSPVVARDSKRQDYNKQKSPKKYVDKGVQQCPPKSRSTKSCGTESSEVPVSSECACTSSEGHTCKILDKIRRECDKYHQKRCKYSHNTSKGGETSSSTTLNCEKCKRSHHCHRSHKCKNKPKLVVDKIKKKCVAYNLILQTSESMISEEASICESRPLRNIIVKVPPKQKMCNMPFREVEAKIERRLESPRLTGPFQRSRSCPNEGATSTDEARQADVYPIKKYLEQNRPDFVEQASRRQHCLKKISEKRNQDQCAPRLKMVVVHPNAHNNDGGSQPVTMYCEGVPMPTQCTCTDPYNMHMVKKQVTRIEAPKFISEREMKKHSEKIYKSLPEVVRKKEEMKKERIKKTNLLMASIFNKNLQKKTLRGAVNLSNYSNVVKI